MTPRVLQVLPAMGSGGLERGAFETARALKKAGYYAVVASSGGRFVKDLERVGIEHVTLPVHSKNPVTMYRNIGRLEKIIKEHNINIVHVRSRAPAYSAKAAAKRAGVHFMTTFHGTYGLGPLGIKKIYNEVMTEGEIVIAISNHIKDHIMKEYGTPESKIRVIHRGADLDQFDPAKIHPERVSKLFKLWELNEDQIVVTLPGRLTAWKGQSLLLSALTKVKTEKPLKCLLIGPSQGRDDYVKDLTRQIRKNKQQGIVQMTGNCDDMPAAMMVSDIVVSASTDPEAFGRVIVEGQAMGRIVIASDHGGARETIEPGKTGFLFPNWDTDTLAFYLEKAINMRTKEREKMMNAAQKSVRENYSVESMCKKTLKVYQEVLEK